MLPKIQKRLNTLMDRLSKEFEISKLSKSPARFNPKKLDWFNRQFIQMMSLEEFSYRASQNKIFRSQQLTGDYRVGDYVMFVDLQKNLVLAEKSQAKDGQDGNYYLIGGGRDSGLPGIANLIKEIKEETPIDWELDESKFLEITNFKLPSPKPFIREEIEYSGKHFFVYFYPLNSDKLPGFTNQESDHKDSEFSYFYDWHDLDEVLATNDFLTYPIWRQFCLDQGLPILPLSKKLQTQYLAWLLDKNRITTLNEFGVESESISNWTQPELELLAWKKMSLEQAVSNLTEIWNFIELEITKSDFLDLQKQLYEAIFATDLNQEFTQITTYLESRIKDWLTQNEKNTGEYLWPLRVALSGKRQSSSPFELLAILEVYESKLRVEKIIDFFKKSVNS